MVTSTPPTAPSQVFHGDDPEQTTEYRSLSVLAIISLVVGLAAPLAVAGPFLLAIPFFGIAISLIALRQIAISEGVLAGRWAATLGLALSVASAVLPISHDLTQRAIRVHQAETFSRSWIDMVTSGNLEQAFHLTTDATRPAPAAEPDAPKKPNAYQTFLDIPIVKSLQAAGAGADVRLRDTVEYQPATYRNVVVRQLYAVSPASAASAGAAGKPFEFVLSVQRGTLPREGMSRWMVTRLDLPKTTDGSPTNR